MVSSCKRIPVVMIEYKASWIFNNIPPKECDNISNLLSQSKDMGEEMLILCNTSAVDVNITLRYETLAFTLDLIFTGEYYNFTSTADINVCVSLHLDYIKNNTSSFFVSFFDDIICLNETINYTLSNDWHIKDRQEHCPAGTEVKNVTATQSNENNIEYYCDRPSITTDSTLEISSQNSTTVVNSTSLYSGSTIETTDYTFERRTYVPDITVNEITTVSTTFDKNDDRSVSYPVKNNYDTDTDRFTTDVQTVVYIGASAGGVVFVVLVVIIAVVCRKKRSRRPGGHSKALEMDVCSNGDDSFKGELIENTLYQSADGFDNKGASMHPSISAEDKPHIPLANSTETLGPDLNTGEDHPSNQTDETK
nr:uncharacterized protein LOC111100915 isoform X2 [Crassostrea virginica]